MKALSIENNLWASAWKSVGPAGWLWVSGAGRQGCIPLRGNQNIETGAFLSPRQLGTWGPGGPGALFAGKQWDPILAQLKELIRQFIACHFSLLLVVSSRNKVVFLVYLCIKQVNAAILLSPGTEGCAALQTLMVWQVSLNKDWKMLPGHGIILHLFYSHSVKVASECLKQLPKFLSNSLTNFHESQNH